MRLVWTFSCKTAPPKFWRAKGEIWLKRSGNSVFMTRELFVCACKDKGRGRCSLGNTRSIFFTVEKEAVSTTEFCYLWGFCPMESEKVPPPFPPKIILFSSGEYSAKHVFILDENWNFSYQLMGRTLLHSFYDHSAICSWDKKGFTGTHFFFRFVTTIQERIITHP